MMTWLEFGRTRHGLIDAETRGYWLSEVNVLHS